ncbi:MAG: DNA polymerase/3'-5' exonuclease PolX [Bacteroidetes bacterium]|nr:DNA polymerase/3'-5' exonuclease PolX [Bacteroidota bacterium]
MDFLFAKSNSIAHLAGMTNSDLADIFKLYADLSELHGGNPFKIKSYAAAAFRIDKFPQVLFNLSLQELESIQGIGKSIAQVIVSLNQNQGNWPELNKLIEETPEGVRQLMRIKGIGAKKVAFIWKELGIENPGELLYACKENRLAQAKGFGQKTQENIRKQIEFLFANQHKFHYASAEPLALQLLKTIQDEFTEMASFTGPIRRCAEVLECIDLLVASEEKEELAAQLMAIPLLNNTDWDGEFIQGKLGSFPVSIHLCATENYMYSLFMETASEDHLKQLPAEPDDSVNWDSEEDIYASIGLSYIEPELREGLGEIEKAVQNQLPNLIEYEDLRGPLHNHSTWSDGQNSIEEMALWCMQKGYAYLGMADHSKSAFYANGLSVERVYQQMEEIDKLNARYPNFRILKGIECDILNDGNLDYENDVLKDFDYVVASIHSNLKMTEEKAMGRLLKAIENPYTSILGHPTGRLLLMREGYPINAKKMIDACAANGVHIEINANPYRLDLDWRHIDYALNKGIWLSINPDAHELDGFLDMYFGTLVARKGGLSKEQCLNALETDELLQKLKRN